MSKSKPADLRKAMVANKHGTTPAAQPSSAPSTPSGPSRDPHYRPGREGKTNVTGYFPPTVKRQLRLLAAELDTTIQDLLGEALNDLFAKHGKPEVVPVEE